VYYRCTCVFFNWHEWKGYTYVYTPYTLNRRPAYYICHITHDIYYRCACALFHWCWWKACKYGVATISRLLKIIGLFCKRALYKRRYSAKETYNFKEPTNRSHLICIYTLNIKYDTLHIAYATLTHYMYDRRACVLFHWRYRTGCTYVYIRTPYTLNRPCILYMPPHIWYEL